MYPSTGRWPQPLKDSRLAAVITLSCALAVLWPADVQAAMLPPSPAPQAAAPRGPVSYQYPLDPSGRVIPDTSYPIPAGSTFLASNGNDANSGRSVQAPVRTLNRAIAITPAGGTIVVRGGEYRDWYNNGSTYKIVNKPINLQAFPREKPWFSGSDLIPGSRWTKVGERLWSLPWNAPAMCDAKYYRYAMSQQSSSGPCAQPDNTNNPSNPMAADPQMVFLNGWQLRQVPAGTALNARTFSYDRNARRIYVANDPNVYHLEVSSRPVALILGGGGSSSIRGIGFHRYASNQYENLTGSAVYIGGTKSLVENVVVSDNAGGGIGYSNPRPGSTIRSSVIAGNGYTGLRANGTSRKNIDNSFVISRNVFNRNNAEGFGERCTSSCGQAAIKLTHMQRATVTRNVVQNTVGPRTSREGYGNGIWCDLKCRNVSYTYNVVTGNPGMGIYHEVSETGIIASNLVTGSQNGIGVASATTKVYNNTLVENVQGIKVYDDKRSSATADSVGPDTRNVSIVNNLVVGRNVSLKAEGNAGSGGTGPADYFQAVSDNSFHQRNGAAPKFAFMRWPDQNGTYYGSLPDFQRTWGLGARTHWLAGAADPFFVNEAYGDYRVRSGSVAAGSSAALPPDVAAALGVSTASGRNRGAFAPPGS